jgi:hypothetical protein
MASKSPGPRLTCAAGCVMDSKWRGGVGAVQVRFRHGERAKAPVDDVSLCSKQTREARPQINTQDHGRSSRSGVSCDLLTEQVAGSPRTPCPNVNLDELEIKVPVPQLLRGRLFDQLLQLCQGTASHCHRLPGGQDRLQHRRPHHRSP